MAGKFLSLEETARRLGKTVEEVNRLVDRKELFPMRGGGTIKFKLEDIERVANDVGAASSQINDDLSLDLDMSAPSLSGSRSSPGSGSLLEDDDEDESIFSDGGSAAPDQTMIRGGGGAPGAFDVDELGLDSLISSSAPELPEDGGTNPPSSYDTSGTLDIDLGDVEGSLVGGSLPLPAVSGIGGGLTSAIDIGGSLPAVSGIGRKISGAIDSGLSLEDDYEASGIDLAQPGVGGDPGATGVGLMSASLAGDAFDLGADLADEESASVVIATEETGDSSFFDAAADDSASVSFDGSGESVDFAGAAGIAFEGMDVVPASPPLSVWQVVGLISCVLSMTLIGLVVFDVLQTVRAPQGSLVTAPVLNALTKAFGW